ncbi:gfo/Idh/MocA family oxidoreductase, partial [Streptomyces sp. NPDC001795]
MSEPLRIGVLGAARISQLSLVSPARAGGPRRVAVGAPGPDPAPAVATN